jgi:hypothetical protein
MPDGDGNQRFQVRLFVPSVIAPSEFYLCEIHILRSFVFCEIQRVRLHADRKWEFRRQIRRPTAHSFWSSHDCSHILRSREVISRKMNCIWSPQVIGESLPHLQFRVFNERRTQLMPGGPSQVHNLKLLSTFTVMSVSTFFIKVFFERSLFLHQRQVTGWQRSADGE